MAIHKINNGGFMIQDVRGNMNSRSVRVTRDRDDSVRITVTTGAKTAGAIIPLADLMKALGD